MNATRKCAIDDCGKKFVARGLCTMHYQRARKDPSWEPVAREIDQFDDLIDKSGNCWRWQGNANTNGYGRISVGGRRKEYVHRIAYIRAHGPIPTGRVVDHKCRNRLCVNPAHLHAVTQAENNQNISDRSSRTLGRGVYWKKDKRRFQVRVQLDGQVHHGGYFDNADDAEAAAVELRARLLTNNFE